MEWSREDPGTGGGGEKPGFVKGRKGRYLQAWRDRAEVPERWRLETRSVAVDHLWLFCGARAGGVEWYLRDIINAFASG